MSGPRWWNRLAAWLYSWINDPLVELATPVWMEEAEADLEEQRDQYFLDDRVIDEIEAEADREGFRDAQSEAEDRPW